MTTQTSTIISPIGVISYPNLFVARMPPQPKPTDKARFSCVVLFKKLEEMDADDQARFKALRAAVIQCGVDKFGQEKVRALLQDKKFGTPFREDIASKGYPAEFAMFIQPWSLQQPGIVSRYEDPMNPGKPAPIVDPKHIFAGCHVRVSLRPFAYENNGNRGVSLGLQNVQLWDNKGPRLDGRTDATNEFTADKPAASLGDLAVAGGEGSLPTGGSQGSADDLSALLG